MIIGLLFVLILILILPFAVKSVEENLELFLFTMAIIAALIAGVMSHELIISALKAPIWITLAVLVSGLVFATLQKHLVTAIRNTLNRLPLAVFMFAVIVILGLLSSFITAIIASLVLVEIISVMQFDRKSEVAFSVVACFAIGLGAALTPVGEPLSTIVTQKLHQNFWYLLGNLGIYLIPGVVGLGLFAALALRPLSGQIGLEELPQEREGMLKEVVRAIKVFLFVFALSLLGEAFSPIVDKYIVHLPAPLLYWINTISAVVDNATLAAAEVSDAMQPAQLKAALVSLIVSGGMLIPGNIPNIIAANKLKIGSREWFKVGVPVGLSCLVIYGFIIFIWPG